MTKIGKRYIDADKLVNALDNGEECYERTGLAEWLGKWLKRQPKQPNLIGRQRAAEIIGVVSPYITVLVDKGDLTPVVVDGAPAVYDEAEAKAVAKAYKKRRRRRGKKESSS
jgi:hypothetical protein